MPPDIHSSTDAFLTSTLDPEALTSQEGVGNALRIIETLCHQGDPEVARVVASLNSRSHLFEYIFSGKLSVLVGHCVPDINFCFPVLEGEACEKLVKWILAGFPTTPATPNVVDSMSVQILQRLSRSLLSVEYPSSTDVPPNLRAFRKKVDLSFSVLRALEENVGHFPTGGDTSCVGHNEDTVPTSNPHIDSLPFDSMGITVPTSAAEIRDVYVQVLSQLKSVLEVCVLVVGGPPHETE